MELRSMQIMLVMQLKNKTYVNLLNKVINMQKKKVY